MTHFKHSGSSGKRRLAFAAPYPGKIIAVRLADVGGELLCQKDAFLCAALGTEVSIAFNRKFGTGCIVAFQPDIDYSIEQAGNLKSMVFGGEGLFLATLRGSGTVMLQSMPFARLADRIIKQAGTAGGGRRQGEGSILGQLGNMLDGS